VHDFTDLEERGVRATFVASTEFIDAADAQARALGVESTGVFVAHPIQDRSDEEMKALAEEAFSRIRQALLG
jgi:hypothetical protein